MDQAHQARQAHSRLLPAAGAARAWRWSSYSSHMETDLDGSSKYSNEAEVEKRWVNAGSKGQWPALHPANQKGVGRGRGCNIDNGSRQIRTVILGQGLALRAGSVGLGREACWAHSTAREAAPPTPVGSVPRGPALALLSPIVDVASVNTHNLEASPLLKEDPQSTSPDAILISRLGSLAFNSAKFSQPHTDVLWIHSFIQHSDSNHFMSIVRQFSKTNHRINCF